MPGSEFLILYRALPIVLPHKLLPWLLRKGLWPEVSEGELREYWEHHLKYATGISAPTLQHLPLWLWGDDCRYGKKISQKVMVCMMGHVLDGRRDSYACCYPLWVCGVDTCTYLIWYTWVCHSTFESYIILAVYAMGLEL